MSNLAATLRHPARALLLVATLGLLACGEPPAPPGPRVGETFPALDLPALDGPPLNLGDYRGRVLVLNAGYFPDEIPAADIEQIDQILATLRIGP